MGNQQIIDILIKVGETAVSKNALKPVIGESIEPTTSSLFKIFDNYDLLINTNGKELKKESFKVDKTQSQDVVFFGSEEEVDKYDLVHYKKTLKIAFTEQIFLIQNTAEFESFLKKVKITSPVTFVNVVNAVIDDHITPKYILRNVASYTVFTENSSVIIDFKDASNYASGLIFYVRNNLQTLYISNVINVLLGVLLRIEITSTIAKMCATDLKNYSNGEKETFLITLIACVILIILFCVLYFLLNKTITKYY